MPVFQDSFHLGDQLLLVRHIENIAGCKNVVGKTAQRIFRRHTIFLGAENDADRRVVIGVVDFGGIVVLQQNLAGVCFD